MSAIPTPFTFVLIGAGRVGTAVASLLAGAGHRPLAVSSRSEASRDRAAELLGIPTVAVEDLPTADVVLLGVPDDAIAEIARAIDPGAVLWHFAGSLGTSPFAEAHGNGVRGVALHPVQACPSVEAGIDRLPSSAWGTTCTEGLEKWAHGVITRDLARHSGRGRGGGPTSVACGFGRDGQWDLCLVRRGGADP